MTDTDRLNWLELAYGTEKNVHGRVVLHFGGKKGVYGLTIRDAIDAAMQEETSRGRATPKVVGLRTEAECPQQSDPPIIEKLCLKCDMWFLSADFVGHECKPKKKTK